MPVTKVKLTICGSNYIVSTTDSEEYVNQLAERLDTDMTEIMTQNPSASVAASAVISALSYLDELNKNASSTDNMRAQIKDYLEDAAKALWKAGIYAETGMGCTGPLVMMSEANHAKALEILKKAGYVG